MTHLVPDKEVEIIALEICEAFTVRLRSDGIVHSHTSSSLEFNVDSLKKFSVLMGNMLDHKQAPLLLTLDEFAIPPTETREFWSKKDSCPYASAEAYIASNFSHKFIGNFYLRFNKPGRPTKIFSNHEDAIKWLKTFL
jgi:hypothetical protein